MNDLIKKDLLNRKIREHFKKRPESNSVIVKANIDGDATVWKVTRESKKTYRVIEVNTKKDVFLISEAPVGGQQAAAGSVPLAKGSSATLGAQPAGKPVGGIKDMDVGSILSLVQTGAQKVDSDVIAKVMAPMIIPKDSGLKKQLKTTWDILNKARNKDAAASSFLGMMQNLMNTPEWLRANRDPALKEQDDPPSDKGKLDKPKKKKEKEEKPEKTKPGKPGPDEEPPPKLSPGEQPPPDDDPGLETGVEPPPGAETPNDTVDIKPKTGEEIQLHQLVQNKPIKDVRVDTDDSGMHVTLELGGLENPLEIHGYRDGKASFEVGELSRTLKTGPTKAVYAKK